jgi:small-conductance mechanosensitive channel
VRIDETYSETKKRLLTAALIAASLISAAAVAAPAPEPAQIMKFLGQSIDWYRQTDVETHIADQPTDVLFVYQDRQAANQILGLAFQYALAQSQLIAAQNPNPAPTDDGAGESQVQRLTRLAAQADDTVKREQTDIDATRAKLANAGGNRAVLQSQLDEDQSELSLAQTRSELLKNILQFSSGTNNGKTKTNDLASQIAELEQTVPEARAAVSTMMSTMAMNAQRAPAEQATPENNMPSVAVPTSKPVPTGILGLSESVWDLRSKSHTLEVAIQSTAELIQSAHELMAPLSASLQDSAKQGADLSNQPNTNDVKATAARKQQIDMLDAEIKHISTAFLPLAKSRILLERYQANLTSWRGAVSSEEKSEIKSLAARLVTLGIALFIAAIISSLWKRATYHYVPDVRRRHQFMLLRRIVMFCVFAIIIALSFSTDLGSLTTFAGLLAAGIAVCLQNVILSAVGYFVLLGKYHVHVGDRVEISGVVGNVVDIDLMRLSLMEVGQPGSGAEGMPTGRTVEFSNSTVFQPAAGFFKQVPGINFVWHQVVITLEAKSDHHAAEDRIMKAVNEVYGAYSGKVEEQHVQMEEALNLPVAAPKPQSLLRFTPSGLEIIVRYPVTRENASEIDDKITRALLTVMENEPNLKSVGSPAPETPVKPSATAQGVQVKPIPEPHPAK